MRHALAATLAVLLAALTAHAADCPPAARQAAEQLLLVKIPATTGPEGEAFLDWAAPRALGGVYLGKRAARALTSPEAVRAYTDRLQKDREPRLFVSIDQEGGTWQSLDPENGFDALPSATDLCARADTDLRAYARDRLGAPLAAAGINMNFAPVLDVALNLDSDIIAKKRRACAADPARVAAYGQAIAEGLMAARVIPVGKHYPGHGDVAGDTHKAAVRSKKPLARLEAEDLVPFDAFVAAHGPAVMVAHIVVEAVDPARPASLSPRVIGGMLREREGFGGVVLTDDLGMRAVTEHAGTPDAAALAALQAGADLLILGHDAAEPALAALCTAIAEDPATAARAAAAGARLLHLKRQFGLAWLE